MMRLPLIATRLVAALAALLLAGCVSLPPPGEVSAASDFVPPPSDQWSASGKFSFRSPDARESGQFYWTQDGDDYLLRLVGPLGVGGAEVEMKNGLARVQTRGEEYRGRDAAALLQELLGRQVRPAGNWQIQYLGTQQLDAYVLPDQLRISRTDMELRIIIDRWTI